MSLGVAAAAGATVVHIENDSHYRVSYWKGTPVTTRLVTTRLAIGAGLLALMAAAALGVTACGGDEGGDAGDARAGELRVAASFYPLAEIAEAVGGDRVSVTNLTPPGTGPHDLELDPQRRADLERADIALYLGAGFQPAIDEAVTTLGDDVEALDLLASEKLRGADPGIPGVRGEVDGTSIGDDEDPHVWVDPRRLGAFVDEVEAALSAADPGGRAAYRRNAAAYREKVERLDRAFAEGLRDCETRTLVTSHAAFGYLTDRYGLEQAPIAGISPDEEPDPKSLAATARKARADGVETVYFETLVPPDLSRTVAREIGARTDALDPVEGLEQEALDRGEDYFSVQRDNLEALVEGLGCTGR